MQFFTIYYLNCIINLRLKTLHGAYITCGKCGKEVNEGQKVKDELTLAEPIRPRRSAQLIQKLRGKYEIDVQQLLAININQSLFTSLDIEFKPVSHLLSVLLITSQNELVTENITVNLLFNRTDQAVDKPICAFWNETIRDFSTVGCNLIQQEQNGIYLCQCDHATFFALIGAPGSVSWSLRIVYTVFVSISIMLGLVVVFLFSKKVVKINRSVATGRPAFFTLVSSLFATASYIFASFFMIIIANVQYDSYTVGCSVLAALEHFFLLVYFFWLLIVVLMNYFTVKFELKNVDRWFKPLSIAAFVLPFLISTIIFFIQFSSSVTTYEVKNGICWLSKNFMIGTILVPVVLISLINLVLIALIIRERSLEKKEFKNSSKMSLFTILTCVLFSGLTWIGLPITLFDNNSVVEVFLYIFTITNALQGVFIFFHFMVTAHYLSKADAPRSTTQKKDSEKKLDHKYA